MMAKRGPKTKYNPDTFPIIVSALAEHGKTDEEIAASLGVSRDTFHKWRKKYPELKEVTDNGKAIADKVVEDSLYNRANGYSAKEKKIVKNPDGTVRQEITEKFIAPDTTACIFWLKNRKPKEWRDKQEIEHNGGIEVTIIDDIKEEDE